MTNGNDPAYPADAIRQTHSGMTIREQFAVMAMQGVLAGEHRNWTLNNVEGASHAEAIAHESVLFADALIDALNK